MIFSNHLLGKFVNNYHNIKYFNVFRELIESNERNIH